MKGLSQFVCAVLLAGGIAALAFAAEAGSNDNPAASGQTATGVQQNSMNGPNAAPGRAQRAVQKMRDDLMKAGFTDIHIMPSSFLVRAKDSSGNPVMMVVNPDSVTAITEENSSSANASPNSAGATPGPKSTGGSQPVTPGASQTKP